MPILSWKDVRNSQHWQYTLSSKPSDKLICCLYADIHKWETKTVSSRYTQYYSPSTPYRNSSTTAGCLTHALNSIPYTFPIHLFAQGYSCTIDKIITSQQKNYIAFLSSLLSLFFLTWHSFPDFRLDSIVPNNWNPMLGLQHLFSLHFFNHLYHTIEIHN